MSTDKILTFSIKKLEAILICSPCGQGLSKLKKVIEIAQDTLTISIKFLYLKK